MMLNGLEESKNKSTVTVQRKQVGLSRMLIAIAAIGGGLALIRDGSIDGLSLAARCIAAGGLFGAAIGIIFGYLLLWALFGACAALAAIIWVALGFRG